MSWWSTTCRMTFRGNLHPEDASSVCHQIAAVKTWLSRALLRPRLHLALACRWFCLASGEQLGLGCPPPPFYDSLTGIPKTLQPGPVNPSLLIKISHTPHTNAYLRPRWKFLWLTRNQCLHSTGAQVLDCRLAQEGQRAALEPLTPAMNCPLTLAPLQHRCEVFGCRIKMSSTNRLRCD